MNQSNFKKPGAKGLQLCTPRLIIELCHSTLQIETLNRKTVTWNFIPKHVPWHGCFWELLIGLTKTILKNVHGRTNAILSSLQIINIEIKAMLNASTDIHPFRCKWSRALNPIISVIWLKDYVCPTTNDYYWSQLWNQVRPKEEPKHRD